MLADVKEWLREEPRQALALGISAVALLLSFLEVVPGPVDPAWLAVLLCGVPIIKEGAEGLFTRFDIKADVLVSLALLASVIIGTNLFRRATFMKSTTMAIIGSILYKACVSIAISLGLEATHMKLITAVLFLLILVMSQAKRKKVRIHA